MSINSLTHGDVKKNFPSFSQTLNGLVPPKSVFVFFSLLRLLCIYYKEMRKTDTTWLKYNDGCLHITQGSVSIRLLIRQHTKLRERSSLFIHKHASFLWQVPTWICSPIGYCGIRDLPLFSECGQILMCLIPGLRELSLMRLICPSLQVVPLHPQHAGTCYVSLC